MTYMPRQPEPELMDDAGEALAYARADFSEVNQAFADRLVHLAGSLAEAEVLDLGTGPGDIPIHVRRVRPRWHITSVDAAPAMLELARDGVECAGLGRRITLVLADAKATGLPAHSFGVIFSNSILHHITEAGLLWAEVRRLAQPRAFVFFRDLARPESTESAQAIADKYAGHEPSLLREEYYRSLLSAYTPGEVRAQLDRAGFGAIRVAMATDRHLDVWGQMT